MKKIILALLVCASCTDAVDDSKTSVIVHDCGSAPLQPGRSVAFENGKAIMSNADAQALFAWTDAQESWNACVTQHE
jgi:hypothetical protein